MAQLNLKLSEEQLAGLKRFAARKRTPVAWLLKDYINYLLNGGAPVSEINMDLPTGEELAALAQHGGAFDWLADEPNIYSLEDGEPI